MDARLKSHPSVTWHHPPSVVCPQPPNASATKQTREFLADGQLRTPFDLPLSLAWKIGSKSLKTRLPSSTILRIASTYESEIQAPPALISNLLLLKGYRSRLAPEGNPSMPSTPPQRHHRSARRDDPISIVDFQTQVRNACSSICNVFFTLVCHMIEATAGRTLATL